MIGFQSWCLKKGPRVLQDFLSIFYHQFLIMFYQTRYKEIFTIMYIIIQLWTLPLAWTSPTFALTPSLFTGWLQLLPSLDTAFAIKRRAVGGQMMRGCPQPGTTSLWLDWRQRQSIWYMCMLSATIRRVNLWLAHTPPVSFLTGFCYHLSFSFLADIRQVNLDNVLILSSLWCSHWPEGNIFHPDQHHHSLGCPVRLSEEL